MPGEQIFAMERKFRLSHRPKPLSYGEDVASMFKLLLWNSPNPGGYQSIDEPLIKSTDLSDEIFDYFTSAMGLDEVICIGCAGSGPEDVNGKIMGLEKDDPTRRMIMAYGCGKEEGQTKMMSMLTHLRNSLAHGRFTLTEDSTFIGFDRNRNNYNFFLRVESGRILHLLDSMMKKKGMPKASEAPPTNWYIVDLLWAGLSMDTGYELYVGPLHGKGKTGPDMTIRHIRSERTYHLEISIMTRLPPSNSLDERIGAHPTTMGEKVIDARILLIPNKDYDNSTVERLNKFGYVLLDKSRLKGTFSGKDMLSNQLDRL
ncbi:hypothetical protein PED39_07005 [Methanomassiliicoccales archaeon LGM-RCC1]|nr:hypothetical protein PED39_07005 [Methanomassiliicoccales archaeon LGM-RCC1]